MTCPFIVRVSDSISYEYFPNWLIDIPEFPLEVYSQIRYNSKKVLSKILFKDDNFKIQFNEAQLAVTPGQSIVFYKDNIVLGGGVIEKNLLTNA